MRKIWIFLIVLVFTFWGCGGGSNNSVGGTTGSTNNLSTISGKATHLGAAEGAVTVTFTDARGTTIGTATTGGDGKYSVNIRFDETVTTTITFHKAGAGYVDSVIVRNFSGGQTYPNVDGTV